MKKNFLTIITCILVLSATMVACSDDNTTTPEKPVEGNNPSEKNLVRAMNLTDQAIASYFKGDDMSMARYYNPYTDLSQSERGSVWMYTSSIEAVNAILHALKAQKEEGNAKYYDDNFSRYVGVLNKLYDAVDYYAGTYTLTSYTQTKEWSVYGVNRAGIKGTALVAGKENVYDDQMWLVREFVEAYKLTGDAKYLAKAEYLTDYVLDGWDPTRDANGDENGGITWGPAYVSKHSCSNGPVVSPLVWLHEIYKGKTDMIEHRYIDPVDKKTRKVQMENKSDYYLAFAQKIYAWQKRNLLNTQNGLYYDSMNSCDTGDPQYETVNNVRYRAHVGGCEPVGDYISYNTGSMLSGAADLYRVTKDNLYLEDAKAASDKSFTYFAKLGATLPGYYTYDLSGFNSWFNGVLMRGYADTYPSYATTATYLNSFQKNLDYGYDNFLYKALLPTSLLAGWNPDKGRNDTEGMFEFAFASQYAILSKFELEK